MSVTLQLAGKAKPGVVTAQIKESSPFLPENPQSPADPLAPVGQNRHVLVVDDNAVVLKAFETKLKAVGFEVATTSNGSTVLSTAEATGAQIIILDIRFDAGTGVQWNGFTIMQWLRRFPEMARVPVILISGNATPDMREKALAAGAVAFFQKPVDFSELLSVIIRSLDEPKPAPVAETTTGTGAEI